MTGLPPRIVEKIARDEAGHWLWQGAIQTRGYGSCSVAGRAELAHRVVYEALVGPIPEGLQIDHLCRVKRCVNPEHLEPVTAAENLRRAAALITACPQGHAYTAANTYVHPRGTRECRTCRADQSARRRAVAA